MVYANYYQYWSIMSDNRYNLTAISFQKKYDIIWRYTIDYKKWIKEYSEFLFDHGYICQSYGSHVIINPNHKNIKKLRISPYDIKIKLCEEALSEDYLYENLGYIWSGTTIYDAMYKKYGTWGESLDMINELLVVNIKKSVLIH